MEGEVECVHAEEPKNAQDSVVIERLQPLVERANEDLPKITGCEDHGVEGQDTQVRHDAILEHELNPHAEEHGLHHLFRNEMKAEDIRRDEDEGAAPKPLRAGTRRLARPTSGMSSGRRVDSDPWSRRQGTAQALHLRVLRPVRHSGVFVPGAPCGIQGVPPEQQRG
eukprot:600002-Hanusia_phi.AAC.2